MPELLDELNVAKGCGTFKKVIKGYQKIALLIMDEWLIRCLTPQESYYLLEIIEARTHHGSMIFCTQYGKVDGMNASALLMMGRYQKLLWTGLSIMPMKS